MPMTQLTRKVISGRASGQHTRPPMKSGRRRVPKIETTTKLHFSKTTKCTGEGGEEVKTRD